METKITATELAKALSDILNRVRYRGERFLIERNGEPVASIIPSAPSSSITLRELLVRLGDLPRPDDRFAEDLEAIQSAQPKESAVPWPS